MLGMKTRQAGLTMIEVMIATIILAAIVAMSSWLVWQASDHVSSSESALQLEMQGREFLVNLTKELRQSRMTEVAKINSNATLVVTPSTDLGKVPPLASLTVTPGIEATLPNPPLDADFFAIRFKLPGKAMDITKKNANNNTDPTNFSLAGFKNDMVGTAWTYEIQYWFEVEFDESPAVGAGPNGRFPDGIDNNLNGVIDEGVIKKIETWYNSAGNPIHRTQSVVCRDVRVNGLTFRVPSLDPSGVAYAVIPNAEQRIQVTLQLQKRDPRYPKDSNRSIFRTVTTTIDVRN